MKNLLRILAVVSSLTLMVVFVLYRSSPKDNSVEISQTRSVTSDARALQHGQDPTQEPTPSTTTPDFIRHDEAGWKPKASSTPIQLDPAMHDGLMQSSKSGHTIIELDPETRKKLMMQSSKSGIIVVPEDAPSPSSTPTRPSHLLPSSKSINGLIER